MKRQDPHDAERRHLRAQKKATREDRDWFRRHPDRCFRVRRSKAYEYPDWGPTDHLEMQYMLVRMSPRRKEYNRHAVKAEVLPNDEAFLSQLWEDFVERRQTSGESVAFSPEDHLRMLQETGVVSEG